MNSRDAELISRMQSNLAIIRKVGGWTTAQFGEEIGVTRQTVSNLEKGRTPLTKTQYLAIRAVLIHEIGANGNEGLAQVVRTLVDEPLEDADKSAADEGVPSPTKDAMEDMSILTALLASTAALTPIVSRTVPAVIYALAKTAKGRQ